MEEKTGVTSVGGRRQGLADLDHDTRVATAIQDDTIRERPANINSKSPIRHPDLHAISKKRN